jgi:hypothetical protein
VTAALAWGVPEMVVAESGATLLPVVPDGRSGGLVLVVGVRRLTA